MLDSNTWNEGITTGNIDLENQTIKTESDCKPSRLLPP